MAVSNPLKMPTLMIRYKGVFDLEGLLRMVVRWFKARKYWFHEDLYKRKPGHGFGREEEIIFHGERKITDFYEYRLQVYFHIWDMTMVDVIQNGVKKKLSKCRIEMIIDAQVLWDYQQRWSQNKFYNALRQFYLDYVIFKKVDMVIWDNLYYVQLKLQDTIKQYLNMEAKGDVYKDLW